MVVIKIDESDLEKDVRSIDSPEKPALRHVLRANSNNVETYIYQ